MWFAIAKQLIFLHILCAAFFVAVQSKAPKEYHFVVKEANYTRLCSTKSILTVNGQFPGPTIRAAKGETVYVNVYNSGSENITLHWHGVKQPRNPWPDGPEYVTQCPIRPGQRFRQSLILSTEEGTLWWHAHSDWSRATVHGAIIIYPRHFNYPFPKFDAEVPIIFGEWWKQDVEKVRRQFLATGGAPNDSDALTINGQPGDQYPCSEPGMVRINVDQGKTYLLRIVNAAMNLILFFSVSEHNLTVVATDGAYTKPLTRDYIAISPGQTLDALLQANQRPRQYYMAARAYSSAPGLSFDNTTTTAIVRYNNGTNSVSSLPRLPYYNDTKAAFDFFGSIKGLPRKYFRRIPLNSSTHILSTLAINAYPCPNNSCQGPNGTHLAASMTNISFVSPDIDVLEAYYYHINGVYDTNFPRFPPTIFNFTADYLPLNLEIPRPGTKAIVLNYGANVELVLQNTNLVLGIDHPIHLHGYSFHVVGFGFGNFNKSRDPKNYNLVDPPLINTVTVPRNGWVTIRFKATNPGVWFMHCHLERHLSWGMETIFIVKDGKRSDEKLLPRPPDMPPC